MITDVYREVTGGVEAKEHGRMEYKQSVWWFGNKLAVDQTVAMTSPQD